ncbi:MAG: ATP-binding protein [Verrucomicrobiota bacterium]|nr:ATP-binding protein [Verrucomicrobiota bacterium]
MKPTTLRARVALWTVAVVTGALILFGASAAWYLRKELRENLDDEISAEAREFISELSEQQLDWRKPHNTEEFFREQAVHIQNVEVYDRDGHFLYRSPKLGSEEILRAAGNRKLFDVKTKSGAVRFAVFEAGDIRFALGRELRGVTESLLGLVSAYLFTLPLIILAAGAGGWWIAHRATAPVNMIAVQAQKISASDLHQRIPLPASGDEIGNLALVLNAMFDRLQRSFEQVTRFTSDASHELKTPLALMRAELELALGSESIPPAQRELLSDLIEQCSELSQIVDGLLFLSRTDDRRLAIEQSPIDLVALVRELLEDAEILAAQAGLTIVCDLPAQLPVTGDVRLLRRAIMNLLGNAIKHNHTGGRVVVTAASDGENAVLAIRNTGPRIPPAAQGKVFERFYRSDSSRNKETGGHGLGLSIAREIARAHRGDAHFVRSDAEWTEFSLSLPHQVAGP